MINIFNKNNPIYTNKIQPIKKYTYSRLMGSKNFNFGFITDTHINILSPAKNNQELIINKNIDSDSYIDIGINIEDFNKIQLNDTLSSKAIINVLDKSYGLGDFLRGSIALAQYAKKYNILFKMDISHHPISNYIENIIDLYSDKRLFVSHNPSFQKQERKIINDFINLNQENLYITTNIWYYRDYVSDDIKKYIKSFFTFKPKYYEMASKLTQMDNYNVLHIRCPDEYFNGIFNSDTLLSEIIKLQLSSNTIVISNNYSIKLKINKLFGFRFIDTISVHTADKNENNLDSTIVDYIILSRSSYTYCFSVYEHGSGFSEQCSILHNIPYKLLHLKNDYNVQPNNHLTTESHNNMRLLGKYYNYCIDWPNVINNKYLDASYKVSDYSNVAFITLTNGGYIDYTLNCLESLKRINTKINLKCYCIGNDGFNTLISKGIDCILINDDTHSNFQIFRTGNWSNITYYKFEIIYNNLLNNEYVCITDGDIVYQDTQFIDFLLQNINDNDILIQSEGLDIDDLCSGFMFIKSTEKTISLFNPENVKKYKDTIGWDDQVYINKIKGNLKFKELPLKLFPNGSYYYKYYKNIDPFLIHFNYIIGSDKKNKMKEFDKWYIN
jgi:hypothetical protein